MLSSSKKKARAIGVEIGATVAGLGGRGGGVSFLSFFFPTPRSSVFSTLLLVAARDRRF